MKVYTVGFTGFEWTVVAAVASNREGAIYFWNKMREKLLREQKRYLKASEKRMAKECPAAVTREKMKVEALSLESPQKFAAFVKKYGVRLEDTPFIAEFELDEWDAKRFG